MITRDPLKPWKRARRVLTEARRRGFETVVALDDATQPDQKEAIGGLADVVIPWTSEGNCEKAYQYVPSCSRPFVFLVSDDEEPSTLMWAIASEPPFDARFGVPVIPVLERKIWKRDVGIQERLFPKKDWSWVGGFEGHSESPYRMAYFDRNPGAIIWHFYLEAPREEREEKAARYERLSPGPEHRARLIWEDHPEGLEPLPAILEPHLK